MKKILLTTALFIPLVIGMSYMSCKPDSFTEEEAMLLQAKLEKERMIVQDSLANAAKLQNDALDKDFEKVTYTLSLVDASKTTGVKGEGEAKGIPAAAVTLTQNGVSVSKTTDAGGVVMFDNLKKGLATLHIILAGYSEVNAVIDFAYFGVNTSVNGGIQFGNVIPMIPLSGTSTGTIKGKVLCETDLTNKVPEPAPTGTKVIATVSTGSAALNSIPTGIIVSINYDNLSLEAVTDVNGDYTMTVPATAMGLDYTVRVSDFTANQSLLMLTKGGVPVTGVQTVPTYFGTTYSSGSSAVPSVSAVTVAIGAPDYTFTQAVATAVISNANGIDYVQITDGGDYYDISNSFQIIIDNPAPGAGGTNAFLNFTMNNVGKVTSTAIAATGAGYAANVENATFTIPYIKTPAKAVVLAVNGSGAITSWRVDPAFTGVFYSRNNLEFVKSTGSGTTVTLPLPSIVDVGNNLNFSSATQTPGSPLGTGYVVNDEFTLAVKSGLNAPMTGKIHMTTGSVTGINLTTEGANYISSKVDVVLSSPGLVGTTATATANVSLGRISSITITNAGTNYSSAPTVTILNKVEKVQAKANATINVDGNITALTLTSNGNGYLTVPAVTITPGVSALGTGASAVAVISGGIVSSLNLINGGAGYIGVNTPATVQNAPTSTAVSVKGSGTSIIVTNLGTGKRTIEN